jgi:hypothetical protein
MTQHLKALDSVDDGQVCPNCGANAWIIDTSGGDEPTFWLLCIDPHLKGCVETRDLPPDIVATVV